LLSRVWGYRHAGGARTVDSHALNLRKKLGDHGERLQSVLGVGYKLQRIETPPAHAVTAARGTQTVNLQRLVGRDRPERQREAVPQSFATRYGFDRLPMPATRRSS
jgi:hypothetical protein